ncbi:PTS transporter subunit IIC [Paenibacillus polymyxa]|nr:PTS transporter subunit IIC [Paenibacillus polymyxa]
MSIIREPSIIIAIVTLLGLIFQRKKVSKIITGTTLSFMGFTMIKVGGGILGGVLTNFSQIFSYAFNLKGVVPSNEAIMALTIDQIGADAALILLFSMILNIVLARLTKFKYIYLSLHLILFMSFAATAVMKGLGLSSLTTIIVGSLVIGSYMAVFSYLLWNASKNIIKSSFKFMIDDGETKEVQTVKEGDSIHFPSDILHGCIPLEDGGILLDAFTPARADFL